MRAPRVLHLLRHYRPEETEAGLGLEQSSAAMQELAPRVEHHLLVTETPRPAVAQSPLSTLPTVHHLSARPLGEAARQLSLAWWFLRHLHRYDSVHFHEHADPYFITPVLAAIAGRRLVRAPGATAEAYPPALRRVAARGIGLCAPLPAEPKAAPRVPAAARRLGDYGLAGMVLPEGLGADETGLGAAASIVDRRFHAAAAPLPDPRPLLLTTIDAEEAFDWSRPFSRDACDVSSMRSQHLAHQVFSRHGVMPLYLADYPVADLDAGRAPLRELLDSGLCDVGAQMHPWVTPPHTEAVNECNSFAGNLPVALELAKARCLTDRLTEAFGRRPEIYRTGRYGVGPRTADILASLGYKADSSLAPCWPPAGRRRLPGAWASAPKPYWVDPARTLMEIPVSAALVGRMSGRSGEAIAPLLFDPRARRLPAAGVMARLGLLERIRLTPEGMTVAEGKRLVRHMLGQGHQVFLLTYHSPSLEPGNTPYVRDIAQRDRFLDWLDEFYTFFREEAGGRFGTWRDVRYATAPQPAPMAALP